MEGNKITLGYYLFVQCYIRTLNNKLMLRNLHVEGLENLPKNGENFFIVCNHQNSANDPLNIAFSLPRDRRIGFMTRADAFTWNAALAKLIRWLGLVPAYRAGWEGTEALEKNYDSFGEVAERIYSGRPIVVFPQGGHTQGHYFEPLTTGTSRMAFHVAQQGNWEKDIKIVPMAHHYEDFFTMRHDFVLKIGKPISLKDYYETYQNKPYSAMRKVRDLMYQSIHSMMLDEGEKDYETKDFLRKSLVNDIVRKGRNIPLTERLDADKKFIDTLLNSPNYDEVIALGKELKQEVEILKIDDYDAIYAEDSRGKQVASLIGSALIDLILLPFWICSLWPNIICYRLPLRMLKEDIMFLNSYRIIVNVLGLYPVTGILTLLLIGFISGNWWLALLWFVLMIPISQFAWWEWLHIKKTVRRLKVLTHLPEVAKLSSLRNKIKNLLK